jgi:hypothetical protein
MNGEIQKTDGRALSDAELDSIVAGANVLREIGQAVVQAARSATHSSTPYYYSIKWGF